MRSGRGPAQDMPPPGGLKLKQTGFAWHGMARWKAVPNARYYEVLASPVEGAPLERRPELKNRINPVETSRQFQAHILGGIRWALSLAEGSSEPNPAIN